MTARIGIKRLIFRRIRGNLKKLNSSIQYKPGRRNERKGGRR